MLRNGITQTLGGLFLTLGIAGACGQVSVEVGTTNEMYFWAQPMKFSLSGSSPGAYSTNGIIARTHVVPAKITSREIIESLNHQLAYTITRSFAPVTVSVTSTNVPNSPTDFYITNYVMVAYPTHGSAVFPSYSPQAKLMLLQPINLTSQVAAPLVVVRDGDPAVDYAVDDYLKVGNLLPAGKLETEALTGSFDIQHDLVSVTRYATTTYSLTGPDGAMSLLFSVGGYTTERFKSITTQNEVVARAPITSLSASVAGDGSVVGKGPCVFRGTVSMQGGKGEVK